MSIILLNFCYVLSISSADRLWVPNMELSNFSDTLKFIPKVCSFPVMYGHFLYKYEYMQTVQLGLNVFFVWQPSEQHHVLVEDNA